MRTIDLTKITFSSSRSNLRKEVINLFLDEKPGTGKGVACSKYMYVTKILEDRREVFLMRPAQFNNGFDFTVNVLNTNFNQDVKGKRATKRPTHNHIYEDLKTKKEENLKGYMQLKKQILLIYNCENYNVPENVDFSSGHSMELLLECIKWLFIEQDVTYWNYSGRAMLYESLNKI